MSGKCKVRVKFCFDLGGFPPTHPFLLFLGFPRNPVLCWVRGKVGRGTSRWSSSVSKAPEMGMGRVC